MKFYDELSKVYEIVFPTDEDTVRFLLKDVKPGSRILDIACGIGDYSIAISEHGFKVDGIDLSAGMIESAQRKSAGLNVNFIVGDMTKIKNIYRDNVYGLCFCIGNSIVHLNDKAKMKELISDMHDMLEKDGSIIVQTVNYDRIIKNNITSLPLIDKPEEGVKFIRKYSYNKKENTVYFNTELIIFKDGRQERYENSVPLIPLMHNELCDMAKSAGFSRIESYGSFNWDNYSDESYASIIRAYK